MKNDLEKRCDRAAQDILNLLAQTLIECQVKTIPEHFSKKMSKNHISALIQTRLNEGREPLKLGA